MALDERSRHRLHSSLRQALGDEEAATMMEMLPPVGWADVATRRDLEGLRAWTEGQMAAVRAEISALRGELAGSEGRLRQEMANQTRTIVFAVIGTMIALTGLVLAISALS